ncbi:MAG TPA: DUF1289 domain-containing protein [Caulobacteraceae bacterium]|jgi:uncharacterized protein
MVSTPAAPIASPCLRVCMVDGRSRHCVGCYRTLPEIARWSRMTDAERDEIMQALPARGERIRAETRARAENPPPTGAAN